MTTLKLETKKELILRLRKEAEAGKVEIVSIIDAMEFRRYQYGLTKKEFATILGMQSSHYSEFLAGTRRLPLNARIKAFSIGVPPKLLLQKDKP